MKLIELEIDPLLSPNAPPLVALFTPRDFSCLLFLAVRHPDLGVFREALSSLPDPSLRPSRCFFPFL